MTYEVMPLGFIITKEHIRMIKKTPSGYKVTSEKGKNLSKPNLTKAGAVKRLREVEYFKHNPKKK